MTTTGVKSWSQTAATNATADSSVNWSEGQAPSSINDSARAMMASMAKYRDDIAGAITTGGTSTAYTVSSYQTFQSLSEMGGQIIAFTPHTTNTGGSPNVTLNVDSLGAKSIQLSPGVELPAGTLVQGSPYVALYNAANGVFYLQNFFGNPYNVPIGGLIPYIGSTAPNSSFVLPYGQAVSRSTYSTLFGMVNTAFGVGDGSTTFGLPDFRGRIIAGKDDMGGSAASRLTSTYFGTSAAVLGAVGGSESHTLTSAQMPTHSHGVNESAHTHGVTGGNGTPWVGGVGSSAQGGSTFAMNTGSITPALTGITIQNAGSGGAHNNVQPTIICNYILRII